MSEILQNMWQAALVTGPVLLILLLGMTLRERGLLTDTLIQQSNQLVFKIAIPAFLFLAISSKPIMDTFNAPLIGYGIFFTLCSAALIWMLAPRLAENEHRGVFTQSVFRSNMGIFGLALSLNAFGDEVLAQAGVYLAVLTVLYNVLSVLLLARGLSQKALRSLITNPLIIGCIVGLLFSALQWQLPSILVKTLRYLADMALPLALLCIGGSMTWRSVIKVPSVVLTATLWRLLLLPLMSIVLAVAFGFRGQDLGILFFMMAAPTASVAFVMAHQMTTNAGATAQIIAVSTFFAPVTIAIGITILTTLSLI